MNSLSKVGRLPPITRAQAEEVVRGVLKNRLGEMPENLFTNSVNQLMEEINGADEEEYSDKDMDDYDF